jgi:hypothetical protein
VDSSNRSRSGQQQRQRQAGRQRRRNSQHRRLRAPRPVAGAAKPVQQAETPCAHSAIQLLCPPTNLRDDAT